MSEDHDDFSGRSGAQHHHVHYHYHYYYSDSPATESRVSDYCHRQGNLSPRFMRNTCYSPESRSFISSPNQWKTHLNPEINKMYQEYRFDASCHSEKKPPISQESEDYDSPSPIKSEVMKTVSHSSSQGSFNKVSRLQELYRRRRGNPKEVREEAKSQITVATGVSELPSSVELKLRQYERQIERLRRYEEECNYLRGRFYRHAVDRHPHDIYQ